MHLDKKRMILKDHRTLASSTYISKVFPHMSEYVKSACSVMTAHLRHKYDLNYVLHDYTLLRNGDEGTGKQIMHRDDQGICNCAFD